MKKKYFLSILSLLLTLTLGFSTVYAEEPHSSILFDDSYTVYDALEDYKDSTNPQEDKLTKNAIETGIERVNQLNKARMGGYTWQMTSMSPATSYGIIKGNYFKKVEAGVSKSSSVDVSFSVSGTVKGLPLTGSAGFTTTIIYNGPTGTEAVGNKMATHRLYSGIAYGTIMRYNYQYKDNYTGHVSASKTEYIVVDKSVKKYSNLVYLNPSSRSLLVRSAGSSKTKTYSSETAYKNAVNSTNPVGAIDF